VCMCVCACVRARAAAAPSPHGRSIASSTASPAEARPSLMSNACVLVVACALRVCHSRCGRGADDGCFRRWVRPRVATMAATAECSKSPFHKLIATQSLLQQKHMSKSKLEMRWPLNGSRGESGVLLGCAFKMPSAQQVPDSPGRSSIRPARCRFHFAQNIRRVQHE
jgi:hypothetical protein